MLFVSPLSAPFSVLRVDSSRDLSYAKVYISVYSKDEAKRQQTFKAIEADAKKIRFELAKVIRARTVPELNFVLDDSMEYGSKMERIINEVSAKDRENRQAHTEQEVEE